MIGRAVQQRVGGHLRHRAGRGRVALELLVERVAGTVQALVAARMDIVVATVLAHRQAGGSRAVPVRMLLIALMVRMRRVMMLLLLLGMMLVLLIL